jgi:hypothetical protein
MTIWRESIKFTQCSENAANLPILLAHLRQIIDKSLDTRTMVVLSMQHTCVCGTDKIMNLDHQYEKFMGTPTVPYTERVHVTIGPGGKIFLNAKAHSLMGCPLAVYLYFNRPKEIITLERTDATTANNAFRLRADANGGRVIYANPFCQHFGIRLDTTQKFINPGTDAVGRMYLKLYETVTVTRGPRKKKT